MFTTKHYKAIATLLADLRRDGRQRDREAAIVMQGHLGDFFKKDNPKFNSDKFHNFIHSRSYGKDDEKPAHE